MEKIWHEIYSDDIPRELKLPEMTIYEMLQKSAKEFPEHKSFIYNDIHLSYRDLKNSCDKLAAALYSKGFRKGDRIAVMLPNRMEYIVAYFAIQRLGCIMVQVNVMYQASELHPILSDSQASGMICENVQKEKIDALGLGDQLVWIIVDNEQTEESSFARLLEEQHGPLPDVEINPKEDVAVLQYTGGTTGKSKGAMLTHYNIVSNAYQNIVFNCLERNKEIILGNSPLFHIMGLSYINITVFSAGTFIIVDRFKVEKVLNLIKEHKPTIFVGAPTMYVALLQYENLTKDDLKSLRICSCGTSPLPNEVISKFEELSGTKIIEGYGLTEAIVTHRNPVSDKRKAGSVGVPLPNTDCKIVDAETGTEEMEVGQSGEILIKGPQVMKGYWNNQVETNLSIRDGWLYTGDIGYMDEDGRFYIAGRKKELIIASGYNIYPIEVEEVLYEHPAVMEVCVYGIPDSYRGETVKATIVLRKGMTCTEEELKEWCSDKLATYKVPRFYEFRDELPKTAVGKILRRKLVEDHSNEKKESSLY
ncbi:long-chain fatty acid--CoA ligase [Sporosarcina sp. P33]|uniref:long-chain-fatty-acid--CoA ligase n=1 Tax=Sporosarcina sp. P33 TaxID=1930764 RepID=UPI0009BE9E58|nr:long-chain fatty acid--CoA ligase [Sporosarcina sp. P33]ARD47949.1 long-chain fatty acid--CoA ligase [Sporosarcina sp. P33]